MWIYVLVSKCEVRHIMQLFPCFYLHKAWNSSGQFATILAGHPLWCVSCSCCCFASIFQGHWRISMMFHWLSCRITAGLLSCFCYSLFYWKLAILPDQFVFFASCFGGMLPQKVALKKSSISDEMREQFWMLIPEPTFIVLFEINWHSFVFLGSFYCWFSKTWYPLCP